MKTGWGRLRFPGFVLALLSSVFVGGLCAQDLSDPADLMLYLHKQKAGDKGLPEIAGTIESATTAKAGWYGLNLKLDNGRELRVMVVPATKFYKDYAPIEPAAAYPQLAKGSKIRGLHDPDQDLLLRNIVLKDLMFESPPVEFAGTIKNASSAKPGNYDLTLSLKEGGERHLNIEPKTNFWTGDKPLPAASAYPHLTTGQVIRALEKPAPGNQRFISDVLLVDVPGAPAAEDKSGFLLMFRPQHVDTYDDMPEDLAKKYPHHRLVMITFQPANHAAAKDGSNLKPGEGSWLDRGMKAAEPGKIRFLVPEDDPNLLTHTLKVSDGPFLFRVKNSGKGYLETVPIAPAHLETAP